MKFWPKKKTVSDEVTAMDITVLRNEHGRMRDQIEFLSQRVLDLEYETKLRVSAAKTWQSKALVPCSHCSGLGHVRPQKTPPPDLVEPEGG